MRHIQLHPLGGAAGDMFVGCLLNAFPEHQEAAVAMAQQLAGVPCSVVPYRDDTQMGSRFLVEAQSSPANHGHTHWAQIRRHIANSALPARVQEHAIGIFTTLAEAEARVHARPTDEVVFHEVGAADSIADIVAAASVIAAISPAVWSVSALPLGGGTVRTAHGVMPVPTPATALLLEGFAMVDDGIGGERVTPTGAAILRYLIHGRDQSVKGTLQRSGTGFGTRTLPGRSNCLRALVFATDSHSQHGHRELGVISFEVDDQSSEDLAIGIEQIRSLPGVHDIVQIPCFGKKSRMGIHIQVLTSYDSIMSVTEACFRETTTIGLRTQLVQGQALRRQTATVMVADDPVRVKVVERPAEGGGVITTAKAEAEDVRKTAGQGRRAEARQQAESAALTQIGQAARRDTE